MLITFKSRASGDVIMFGNVALEILEIMGKGKETKGILTVDDLPEAIARLAKAADENRAEAREKQALMDAHIATLEDEQAILDAKAEIHLCQRAVPLIELMGIALKKQMPVTWAQGY